ncbi:MAG: amino acid adenylation domain-containing protein [Anaerovoracaceae bacterium]
MKLFLDQLTEHIEKMPEKIAIVDFEGSRETSYRGLDVLSNRIGALLLEQNVKKGDFVPVILPRKMEYIGAALGILKVGGVFLPLSTGYPEERISFIVDQCQAKVIIDEEFLESIPEKTSGLSWPDIQGEDRAIGVYTSGSTGKPKGIVHNHFSFLSGARRFGKGIGIKQDDVQLSNLPFNFIAILVEVFAILFVGGTIHINSEEGRKDIHRIEDYIAQHRITSTLIVPQMIKLFKNKSDSLKKVTCGSERVTGVKGYGYELFNIYGASETTPATTYFKVDKEYDNTPIGKPFDDVHVYVQREDGSLADSEEVGEICVSGSLAEGYLNMPEKTAETFTYNPYATGEDDKILYHSGDMGMMRKDGNLVYVNRKDWMVKINGQRVETQEIETIIRELSYVKEAVVKGFENQYGQTYMCSYYQLENGSFNENPSEMIKKELKKKLADYMMPQFFVRVDSFPVNQNGKLDRLALKAPDASSFKREYEAPKTETEKILCGGFKEILNIEKIGCNDDFFSMGGDSIKVVRLLDYCKELPLTSAQIFKGKTPKSIASLCGEEEQDLYKNCKDKKDFYPLTDSQLGVFLECIQSPDSVMYNIPFGFEIPRSIDVIKLKKALIKAIDHYPILKIAIKEKDGQYGMVPNGSVDYQIPFRSISREEVGKIKSEFVKPIDLGKGPLFRVELYEGQDSIYLFADFHHIISDGASVANFFEQVGRIYGGQLPKEEAITQFNLSNYELDLKETEIYHQAQDYFENYLAGNEVDSNPVFDKVEDPDQSVRPSERLYCNLKGELAGAELEEFTRRSGITENTFFLGAFAYALGKYTGQTESMFSAVNNGRHDPRMSNTMGMLVRTLPIYVAFDEEKSISEFLNDMQDNFFKTMDHDCCSFGELANQYGVTSDLMFVYQAQTLNAMNLDGCEIPLQGLETGCSLANVALHIFKKNGSYDMFFEYRSDIYDKETLRSFSNMLIKIVKGFLSQDYLKDVALISEDEIQRLESFYGNVTPYDKSKTLVDLFRQQVEKSPDKTAVVYKEKRYSYREVDQISEKIGAYIHSKNIGREQVVSILIPRCEYMPIASLGVMKAGAAYQPLDPTYPMDRLGFMMKDADTKLLIVDESLLHLVPEYKGQILMTKEIPDLPSAEKTGMTDPSPNDLFILLYTSGTTGTPKGCMITQNNIVAFCNWYRGFYHLEEDSVVAAYASFGFDANMMDMYPALTSGATVCIIPEELRLELPMLNEYFEKEKVTHAFMTTQVGRQFVSEIENHSLKYLSTGGETLVPVQSSSKYDFYNLYGPTEATVLTTAFKVDKTKVYNNVPIGRAMDNMELYILDNYKRRVPVGALGELCIAGHQVSRGYLNRTEQTQKVYEANPFSKKEGFQRIYHTGDIVRYINDGNVQFIGRRDGQVKIRGFRVEITEVESIIREYPGIKDATVTSFDAIAGGKAIAAYIVSDETIDIDKLEAFIREEKPPYMVPAVTMQIEAIPLNQNMKVNRKALPDPKSQSQGDNRDKARPLTLLEKELKELVKSIVGHEEFAVNTELINAGITSLSAIKLATAIEKEYGMTIQVKQIMKQCSILSIEDEIYAHLREGNSMADSTEDKKPEEMADYYPLTQAQMGVFYDDIKSPEGITYNIPAVFSFPKEVTGQKLREAVKDTLKAHPYINTRLEYKEGQLVQVPFEEEPEVGLLSIASNQLEAFKADFVKPFVLENQRLYRLNVVETKTETYLFADFHHIIFDGGSLDLFLHQVANACQDVLPEAESYSHYDHASDLESATRGESYVQAEKFFGEMLQNFQSASEITGDLSGIEENGKKAECIVPCDEKKIDQFCKANSVTPAHLFLAGVFYTLARFTSSKEVYISTISNGRSDLKVQNALGMFVNTLPLRGSIEGEKTVIEFIGEAKNLMVDVVYHEIYPFTQIASDYGFSPQIMYACQLGVLEKVECFGKEVVAENLESDRPKFKIAIHIEDRNETPAICLQYNDEIYSQELMNQLGESIGVCVEKMMENPNGKLNKISLITKKQHKQLEEFKESAILDQEEVLFHGAFEKHVKLHGEKTALVATEGSYTYKELDLKMNKIANALVERGLKSGEAVAILLPRTGSLIMAMYGVMKAGGAYIPCDPDYPEERIHQITRDSSAVLIITTKERVHDFENGISVEELLDHENTNHPQITVKGNDLAYMIYTSGSTGKPKGVMLEHRGIANYLVDHPANSHVHACASEGSVMVSVTTVSFDMSLKETAVALCNGLTLVLADEECANHPVRLARLMKSTKGDVFNATPSRMLQYMDSTEFCEALGECKVVMSGGEQYTIQLLEKLKKVTKARIFNTYGPTEITVSSNAKELTKENDITIGPPLLNYTEYIGDNDGNLLPPGVMGELYIGGVGVSRGYHNLPEMTEKMFMTAFGERVYRSGDYARWTKDGDVVILGRTDNQVKLRGLRIELEEIETCISQYPGIKNAVTLIREINKVEHLCAYYTADTPVEVSDLKDSIKEKLTKYMVPTGYCQLDQMPMTPNGKIDRKSLPEAKLVEVGEYVAPTSETEVAFCNIFKEVLSLDKVGTKDDFFELGGTSLTVTRVIIEATEAGFDITYGDVFTNATPEKLAAMLGPKEGLKSDFEDLSVYDYGEISKVLEKNTLDSFLAEEPIPLENIILTGATGFLGIHILKEFLETEEGIVYCIIRKGNYDSLEDRIKSLLFYYFENTYEDMIGSRIILVEGDVTNKKVFEGLYEEDIQTVINCAANVKHFSKGTDIEDVNVGGVVNAIQYCKATGSRIVHISTTSVSGFSIGEIPPSDTVMTEKMLYFGQGLDTKYGHSKFLAERTILQGISEGLKGKIMRVGNLSARDTDGEFQMNFATNSFVGRLKSYQLIGKFPYSMMGGAAEMAPIDSTSKAILALSKTPESCCVFHPYNNHSIFMGDIINAMKMCGIQIELAEESAYAKALEAAQKDPEKAAVLSSMIAYQNMGHGKKTVPIGKSNEYTMQVLYRLNYHWPSTSKTYVKKFVEAMEGMGFFA